MIVAITFVFTAMVSVQANFKKELFC